MLLIVTSVLLPQTLELIDGGKLLLKGRGKLVGKHRPVLLSHLVLKAMQNLSQQNTDVTNMLTLCIINMYMNNYKCIPTYLLW